MLLIKITDGETGWKPPDYTAKQKGRRNWTRRFVSHRI